MTVQIPELYQAVKTNCHIADARHAADYTLCTYLMKMRELYRWEQGIGFEEELGGAEVSNWVRERESYWEDLEEQAFQSLPLQDALYDPFDQDALNAGLQAHHLVYSAGLGQKSAPHFFLADLVEHRQQDGFEVMVTGKEHARDLASPPAMSRGKTIFLRQESLRRMLWERVQEWRWNRCDSPMGRALVEYQLDENLQAGLERLMLDQSETLLLHEIGEVEAGRQIGFDWHEMLMALAGTKAELQLRAVRDHLADALQTLPGLLEPLQAERLHFYIGMLSPMRKSLAPALLLAYEKWRQQRDSGDLQRYVSDARKHWLKIISQSGTLFADHERGNAAAISTFLEESAL